MHILPFLLVFLSTVFSADLDNPFMSSDALINNDLGGGLSSSSLSPPSQQQQQQQQYQADPAPGFINPHQCTVDDGCDDTFSTIDSVNQQIRPSVVSLVNSDFFKYFKLQLYKSCPFWPENPMCFSPSCAVEIEDDNKLADDYGIFNNSENNDEEKEGGSKKTTLVEYNCDYCNTSEESQDDAVYVDLTLNPERFSGYGGEEAGRIWSAIYQENCFNKPKSEENPDNNDALSSSSSDDQSPVLRFNNKYFNILASWSNRLQKNKNIDNYQLLNTLMNQEEDKCIEKRVFYRLVSGMHASIGTHLSFQWLNTNKKHAKFEPNLDLWMQRVGYFSDRLSNIYFNYSLVLKAILKLGDYLNQIQFSEANIEKDLINNIVDSVRPYENSIFNESLLFNYEDDLSNQLLKNEFKANFKNVSSLMDCVGCERCRLWGKVQTLGYGTSLKILFELNDKTEDTFDLKSLKRSEIVALINTFDRLSKSVEIINYFRNEWKQTEEGLLNVEEEVKATNFKDNEDILNENEKMVSYQQKIFKHQKSTASASSSSASSVEAAPKTKKSLPSSVKMKNVDESKADLKKMFLDKKKEYKSSSDSRWNTEVDSIVRLDSETDEDIENLSPEAIKHRHIFRNSLKLRSSKPEKDKTFRDNLMESIEEVKDAFRFLWESYLYFPYNLYRLAMARLEVYWNYYIGNEEFFLQQKKDLHFLDSYGY
ncbi:ER oxidoreductin [Saccharomycopsis crataegensis]|uniref:ER oxidoreductin n=1 Tax=Saccharomycopsis crataegensis TaxID=43959 RepID=A0AAV5QHW9_9ASCO|nr:ER oxidoreductin [Saccharomycopsis crataegensis]